MTGHVGITCRIHRLARSGTQADPVDGLACENKSRHFDVNENRLNGM